MITKITVAGKDFPLSPDYPVVSPRVDKIPDENCEWFDATTHLCTVTGDPCRHIDAPDHRGAQ